jgi:hypothetical protein
MCFHCSHTKKQDHLEPPLKQSHMCTKYGFTMGGVHGPIGGPAFQSSQAPSGAVEGRGENVFPQLEDGPVVSPQLIWTQTQRSHERT